MELFTAFLQSLFKLSPLIGLLCIAIWYFYTENKQLKLKNDELNKYIQDESVKNMEVLTSLSKTIDRVLDDNERNTLSLKEWITIKIDSLK